MGCVKLYLVGTVVRDASPIYRAGLGDLVGWSHRTVPRFDL